jgi:RNA binding exosome subunit
MSKIYGGNAKIIETKFGQMTKISQSRSDLEKLLAYLNANDTEWVNLVMKEKQEKVEGKATHYLEVDDWKPMQRANKATEKRIVEKDNLPF